MPFFWETCVDTYALQAGDVIKIKTQTFSVSAVEPLTLRHEQSGEQVVWHGGTHGRLQPNPDTGPALNAACPEDPGLLGAWLPDLSSGEKLLFTIGGSVHCAKRWGIVKNVESDGICIPSPKPESACIKPLLKPNSARIYQIGKDYWLGPGADGNDGIRFKREGESGERRFSTFYTPFLAADGDTMIESLVLGRSLYAVEVSDETLSLKREYGDVWTQAAWDKHKKEPGFTKNDRVEVEMSKEQESAFGESLSLLSNGLGLTSLLVSAALALGGRLRTHSGALWVFALALLLVGNLVLLQLVVGGLNEHFLQLSRHFLMLSLAFQALLFLLSCVPQTTLDRAVKLLFTIDRGRKAGLLDWGLWAVLLVYVLALGIQVVKVAESGLGSFQPVEFSKFIIVLLGAISAAQYYEKRYLDAYASAGEGHGWSLQQTGLLFAQLASVVVLTALMLAMVRDFSPIVLILIFLLIFIWRLLPHPVDGSYGKFGWTLAGVLTVMMALPVWVMAYVKREGIVPSFLKNPDRFQVWAKPELYPHSGSQVRDSMSLIADSRPWGAEHWFAANDGALMQLPAVQDDFIATFLIAHFGYYPALALLAVQLLFVLQLVRLSNALLRGDNHLYDSTPRRQMGFSSSLFCFGFAGLLLAHWLISWCNVLGLLPVMGQPMTLLSAGGSNLILFFVPCLLLCFCFAWLKELPAEG